MSQKLQNASANRNQEPILEVLKNVLNSETPNLRLLEIASGTGQHSALFADAFPNIHFQPTEYDRSALSSIQAYASDTINKNMSKPYLVDIRKDFEKWETGFDEGQFDYMLNINMIHITPYECTEGLFRNAGRLLRTGGLLITYGPYAVDGVLQPESNVMFDRSLRRRDASWGVRDIKDLKLTAASNKIEFRELYEMPSNNKTLIWQKV